MFTVNMPFMRKFAIIFFLAIYLPANLFAGDKSLPIPRFVTIKAKEANVRVGPGTRYPTKWVIMKQYMPVEIIAEFEYWRQIKDINGDIGWVHKSVLSSRRGCITINKNPVDVTKQANNSSEIIARIETGVICKIHKCVEEYCEISANNEKGWIKRSAIWGIYANENPGSKDEEE